MSLIIDETEIIPYQSQKMLIYKGKQPKSFTLIFEDSKKAKIESKGEFKFTPFRSKIQGSHEKIVDSNSIQHGSPDVTGKKSISFVIKSQKITEETSEKPDQTLVPMSSSHEIHISSLEHVKENVNGANLIFEDVLIVEKAKKRIDPISSIDSKFERAFNSEENEQKSNRSSQLHHSEAHLSFKLDISPISSARDNSDNNINDSIITTKPVIPSWQGVKKPFGFWRFNGVKATKTLSTPNCHSKLTMFNFNDSEANEIEVLCSKCHMMIKSGLLELHSNKCFYQANNNGNLNIGDQVPPIYKTNCLLASLGKCIQKNSVLRNSLQETKFNELSQICNIAESIVETNPENIQKLEEMCEQVKTIQAQLGNNSNSTCFLYLERLISLIQVKIN